MVAASTPPPRCACSSASGSSAAKTWFTGAGGAPGAYLLPSTSLSSPSWNISVTMSQPPTSLPSTKSCGIVGHSDQPGQHLADAGVDEDVAGAVVHVQVVEDLDDLVREAAARHLGGALHVEEHPVVRDLAL